MTSRQGDVMAILNTSGTAVVQYTYDAWGNVLSTTGSYASTLGQQNPIRYRGYVYDQETGLYYLQSRYYNPEVGRFISSDIYACTGQGLLGNNMFAYCRNNPVRRRDVSGMRDDECVEDANEDDNPLNDLGGPTGGGGGSTPQVSGGSIGKAPSSTGGVSGAPNAANNPSNPGAVNVNYGNEVKLPNQINANDAVNAWDEFLGPNQTNYNRFTGSNDMNRIFSADGTRSVRFGDHEMRSLGTTKAHFHYEKWIYDPGSNTVHVMNYLQRLK